ncbi:vitelline membrane outer layer protein 1 homolog [Pelobates fuscus]|uniref:vitelline membrane outer layer protein 1 homolog n=1 Tax=Pelobates fuscus TaxID=191477 RepID=UPI002FE4DA4A
MILTLLSFILVLAGQTAGTIIEVPNGAQWGTWGTLDRCAPGTVAKGFTLKVQGMQGLYDDTALNGIRLHCVRCQSPHNEMTINSTVADWGKWGPTFWCPYGYLMAFSLRVEGSQGKGDDTAANNIKLKCSDGSILEGNGLSWGTYGDWSDNCTTGVCGMESKVEDPQPVGDNTALNDVRFTCCDREPTLHAQATGH